MSESTSHRDAMSELFEGAYYSIRDGNVFAVAKVLKLDANLVHVRIYKQHFPLRPRAIDPRALTLGTINDKDGFGMGHLPLRLEMFTERLPIFLAYAEVKPEELEGYNFWKENADGGVFEF